MKNAGKQGNAWYIVTAVFFIALLLLTVVLREKNSETVENPAVRQGITYLKSLEQKDPARIRQIRKDIFRKKLEAQRNEMVKKLRSGETDPYSMFQDYVVFGDSRAVGFWYHGFLEKSRVLADGGHTIRNIAEGLEQLKELNPSYVYLCYGLNDSGIGYWQTGEAYAAEYMTCIAQIKQILPEATVVISSILPARDPAFQRSSKWRRIPDWNKVLKKVCEENGIIYADCDALYDQYPDLWDPDGIHFRKAFYPHWGVELIASALMGEPIYED